VAESEPSAISPAVLGKALSAAGKTLAGGGDDGAPPSLAASAVTAIAGDMAEIRKHLTRIGAALGAAAVAILGGLGYAQVHQAFPLPAGSFGTIPLPRGLIWLLVSIAIAIVLWYWVLRARMRTLWNTLGFVVLVAVLFFLAWAPGWVRGDWSIDISHSRVLTTALALGSLLAVGGAAWLASRFFGAQRRIVIASDGDWTKLPDKEERRACEHFFAEVAQGEGAASLLALDFRAGRLDRIARRLPEESEEAKRAHAESTALKDLVLLAIYTASLLILEYRSSRAFDGLKSKIALGMTVLGLILVFGIADYAKGQRDLIDLRAECQKAVTAGAADACDPVRNSLTAAAAEVRLAQAKEELDEAVADARETLEGDAPQTPAQKVDWLAACVTVLRAAPALKTEPGLSAKCAALLL
jgi:hypothetical protein